MILIVNRSVSCVTKSECGDWFGASAPIEPRTPGTHPLEPKELAMSTQSVGSTAVSGPVEPLNFSITNAAMARTVATV